MAQNVKLGSRLSGIAGFLNLKKVFDDAVQQNNWKKEQMQTQIQSKERMLDKTLAERRRSSMMSVAARLAGGGGDTMTAGESMRINQIIGDLSKRRTGDNKPLKSRQEAEDYIRDMGIDPSWDPRIPQMLNQYGRNSWWDKVRQVGPMNPVKLSPMGRAAGFHTPKRVPVPVARNGGMNTSDVFKRIMEGDESALDDLINSLQE